MFGSMKRTNRILWGVKGCQSVSGLLIGTAVVVCLFGTMALAAGMTARDVTSLLFNASRFPPPDLSGQNLSELDLAGLDFKGARLAGGDFYGADLTGANLAATDLRGAKLDRATIIDAEFSSANLEGATILRPNAFSDFESDRREAPRFAGARMKGAKIIGRLDWVDFRWSDLSDAVFGVPDARAEVFLTSRVLLNGANFSEATLKGAVFMGASLRFARFRGADLRGADLRDTDLTRADFTDADLTGANVTAANLDEANFAGARGFSKIRGFAEAKNFDRAFVPN
jgi:uncharacterized protein YjbI with pentapeptide repeats